MKIEVKVVRFERLPHINMRIKAEPLVCLKGLEKIARADSSLRVRSNFEGDGEIHSNVVSFGKKKESEHEGLFGMFVHWKRDGQSLRLQLAAHRWNPDPPTYDSYVAAAQRLFQPVIDAYNEKHRVRHRMRIQSREETQPTMTPKAREAFNHFVFVANKSSLHPSDWEAFYRFVYVCRRTRLYLYDDEVRWFCRHAGFSQDHAEMLSVAYHHCYSFHAALTKRRLY